MSNGVRLNSARNFKGEKYASENFVQEKVQEAVKSGLGLPEGVDSLIDPQTGKLAAALNPGVKVQLNGVTTEQNATTINFIGNCMVVKDGNGIVKTRIGENVNSSNFGTNDGQTDGTVSRKITTGTGYTSTSSATPASDLPTNGGTTVWKDEENSSNKLTISPAGKIHFDSYKTKFELDLIVGKEGSSQTRRIFTFGPISKDEDYSAYEVTRVITKDENDQEVVSDTVATTATEALSLTVSNLVVEALSSKGATGYEGNIEFTVDVKALISANTDFKFEIRHINGAEGTKSWTGDEYIFWIEDISTKPSISGEVTYSLSGLTHKQISGVTYLTGGTATVSASGISKLSDPAYVDNKVSFSGLNGSSAAAWIPSINQTGTDGLTDFTGKTTDSVTYSGTSTFDASSTGFYTDAKIKVVGKNVNGDGSGKSSSTSYSLLIDKTTNSSATGLVENFASETGTYPRLADLSNVKGEAVTVNWDSSWDLGKNATVDGVEKDYPKKGLQIKNGQLLYPTEDYTGANSVLKTPPTQPNYSNLTGVRSYMRWFEKTGSLSGGSFTLVSNSAIESYVNGGTLNLEVSKDGSKWYDIARLSGIGTAFSWDAYNSSKKTYSSKVTFVFTDGTASGGMYFRISMASSSVTAKINSITMA